MYENDDDFADEIAAYRDEMTEEELEEEARIEEEMSYFITRAPKAETE